MTLIALTAEEEFESHESSFADIIERLFQQFESKVTLNEIVTVVRNAREQLRGSPLGALPELTERLAIERLTTLGANPLRAAEARLVSNNRNSPEIKEAIR